MPPPHDGTTDGVSSDSFDARAGLSVGEREYEIHRLDALQSRFDVARLPYSLKVLLENALRLEDGHSVSAGDVEAIATWERKPLPGVVFPCQPAELPMMRPPPKKNTAQVYSFAPASYPQ